MVSGIAVRFTSGRTVEAMADDMHVDEPDVRVVVPHGASAQPDDVAIAAPIVGTGPLADVIHSGVPDPAGGTTKTVPGEATPQELADVAVALRERSRQRSRRRTIAGICGVVALIIGCAGIYIAVTFFKTARDGTETSSVVGNIAEQAQLLARESQAGFSDALVTQAAQQVHVANNPGSSIVISQTGESTNPTVLAVAVASDGRSMRLAMRSASGDCIVAYVPLTGSFDTQRNRTGPCRITDR